MSEEKVDKMAIVAEIFQPEELAVIYNVLGEVPLKLNSKEVSIFSALREKIKKLHEGVSKIQPSE